MPYTFNPLPLPLPQMRPCFCVTYNKDRLSGKPTGIGCHTNIHACVCDLTDNVEWTVYLRKECRSKFHKCSCRGDDKCNVRH